LIGIAVGTLGCQTEPEGDVRPDLLLITIDTLRADRLGCYGDERAQTPVLDGLAAAGVRFTAAAAPAPITLPSHASLLTGRYPAAHGTLNNGTFALPASETTLAELLTDAGYRSAAFLGAYPLAHPFGLGQGFALYDDRFEKQAQSAGGPLVQRSERRAAQVTDAALGWLRSQTGDDPIFTWVHYFDPHADYDPPPPFDAVADPYRGEIAYADREIGRLLDGLADLGRRDRTLIVVASDHGEAFGEHGVAYHGLFIYEQTIRVPLIFHWPDRLPGGEVVEEVVSLVDVLPTLCSLLGLVEPANVQGLDLVPVLEGSGELERDAVLIENRLPNLEFGWSPLFGVRTGRFKYIAAPREELYDLAVDPGENDNLADREHAQLETSRELLEELLAESESIASGDAGRGLDAEAMARLRGLG